MSLKPKAIPEIPELTVQVARAGVVACIRYDQAEAGTKNAPQIVSEGRRIT